VVEGYSDDYDDEHEHWQEEDEEDEEEEAIEVADEQEIEHSIKVKTSTPPSRPIGSKLSSAKVITNAQRAVSVPSAIEVTKKDADDQRLERIEAAISILLEREANAKTTPLQSYPLAIPAATPAIPAANVSQAQFVMMPNGTNSGGGFFTGGQPGSIMFPFQGSNQMQMMLPYSAQQPQSNCGYVCVGIMPINTQMNTQQQYFNGQYWR
jgi:hypothetical protein